MSAAVGTVPNGNGSMANGHAEIKKSAAKSRGALKRLKAKAKAAKAGTESEPETDKESDTEVSTSTYHIASKALELMNVVYRVLRFSGLDCRFGDS
jgi:splicing factor 3B subunit 2